MVVVSATPSWPELTSLDFILPAHLEASEPAEARGLRRDEVRLMVSHYRTDAVEHAQFYDLTQFLRAGDLLIVNGSGAMNAAVNAQRDDGAPFELHLSTQLASGDWTVELRQIAGQKTTAFFDHAPNQIYGLPNGGEVVLHQPYCGGTAKSCQQSRLWTAHLNLPLALPTYLEQYGFPIRYSYVQKQWPISYYRSVYTSEVGSAEMPSAGRAFTTPLLAELEAQGIRIAPIILHTGVASLEEHEPPYEEFYRVPSKTAVLVNETRAAGNRVIAVGTTAVRALETVADKNGRVQPGQGWTDLVITPNRGAKAIDGLITGFHEPRATHLAMLAALAGQQHLQITYKQALAKRYLWHEFGDLHLILP